MDSNQCLLCEKVITESEVSKKIGERAIATLISSSERRKDKKDIELRKHSSIIVHSRCQALYTTESQIKAAEKKVSENLAKRRKLMKEERQFDFSTSCFFCGLKAINTSKKKCSIVSSNETKVTILEKICTADAEFSERVAARIRDIDLVAVEARYHSQCMSDFYRLRESVVIGRPLDEDISDISTKVINFILENDHESQFSLKDILKIESFEGIPNINLIKIRLTQYFKDDIIFFTKYNDLIICFRDAKNKVITDAWYNDRCKDEEEE